VGQTYLGRRDGRETEESKALQVLSAIDRLTKKISIAREAYDSLSEYSHPNWFGTAGMFCFVEKDQRLQCVFGPRADSREQAIGEATSIACSAVELAAILGPMISVAKVDLIRAIDSR
jgi:hypothetical protein